MYFVSWKKSDKGTLNCYMLFLIKKNLNGYKKIETLAIKIYIYINHCKCWFQIENSLAVIQSFQFVLSGFYVSNFMYTRLQKWMYWKWKETLSDILIKIYKNLHVAIHQSLDMWVTITFCRSIFLALSIVFQKF